MALLLSGCSPLTPTQQAAMHHAYRSCMAQAGKTAESRILWTERCHRRLARM